MPKFFPSYVIVFLLCGLATVPGQEATQGLRKQYKRVHQEALKQILTGETKKAVADLEAIVAAVPDDAESHYMLAVAHAKSGQTELALEAMQRGFVAGLPAERFITGTLTGLESVQATKLVRQLRQERLHRPAHGPMLGCVSGSGVQIWLRTITEAEVTAIAWPANSSEKAIQSDTARTSKETDFTAKIQLHGLEPNTAYHYAVKLNGVPYREATYRFRTLSEKGHPVRFRLAFGGGAGFVPEHETMWDTIRAQQPDVLLLLGDNVYSDDPRTPEMQHYCYYRRQSRPEYRRLVASTPVFSIWDDHDFGTNDCSGGPDIHQPAWKLPVYRVFRNNWVNPYYGGGEEQPGCYYDFYLGDVHFLMLDGRYYRNLKPADNGRSTMLGPVQRKWLLRTIRESQGRLMVLCSPVPWVFKAKGKSKDTWNGFPDERKEIFDFLSAHQVEGVFLMSADRHRSDLWKIDRPGDYSLYEFNSSRLTNQHVHPTMKAAMFSYNTKPSFGLVDIDTTLDDPVITYRIVSIDGDVMNEFKLTRSQLVR